MTYDSQKMNDRRDALFTALLILLKTKPLSKISVTQLCQEAHVSRMFYYRNYTSFEDVITEKLERIFRNQMRFMEKHHFTDPIQFGTLFFSFYRTYVDELKTFIRSDLKYLIYYIFKDDIIQLFQHGMLPENRLMSDHYWQAFVSAGLTETLFDWVINGAVESDAEMGEKIAQIIHNPN